MEASRLALPVGEDGVAVFEGVPLRHKQLALDELEALSAGPSPLHGAFRIRLARKAASHRDAASLVEQRYMSRGYDVPRLRGDPNLFTFVAYDEGHVVGTVSLRLDSDEGLAADTLYGPECAALRSSGERLCEFTRLAVDVSAASKPVLAALFHTAYLFASELRSFTSAVIEVNPRHVAFYRRALAFRVVGEERMNERVKAPAVLMCAAFSDIAAGLERYAGCPEAASKTHTLFPFGFCREDAAGILNRLRDALCDPGPALPDADDGTAG